MSAVLEKKYLLSEEIMVMGMLDLFLTCLAAVTPAIPFPMMTKPLSSTYRALNKDNIVKLFVEYKTYQKRYSP